MPVVCVYVCGVGMCMVCVCDNQFSSTTYMITMATAVMRYIGMPHQIHTDGPHLMEAVHTYLMEQFIHI